MGKQRSVIFLVTTGVLCSLNVLSLFTQPLTPVARVSAVATAAAAAILLLAWCFRKSLLRRGLAAVLMLSLGQNIVESVSYVQHYASAFDPFIVTDILTSLLMVMAALVAFLRYTPTILSALSVLTIIYVVFKADSPLLWAIFPVYVLILITVIIYDSLAAQRNVLHSVATTLREGDADRSALRRIFPEFSETQLSIAQLIIQGKRTSEICRLLDKTEGNITAQRTHIRTKMGLRPEENLRESLLGAVVEWRKSAN